ncbi:MAG: IPT/TIG domain-containing protein [Saprospiraceae bacterium]|nr:IPT/TIG domain-containing protein [Saprospiraceae bacterium]MDW8228551.1 IPT/TIG domain-containing protein [Saprospiraceae bacterium]
MRSLLPAFFGLFALPLCAQLYELPFAEIFQRSVVVVEGRVVAQQSLWDNGQRGIYTCNLIEVSRVYKGRGMAERHLNVITLGGIVGDRMQLVSESVQYDVGEYGLFCLIPCAYDLPMRPIWENYGSPHGFFLFDTQADAVIHPFHATSGIAVFRQRVEALTGRAQIIASDESPGAAVAERMTPSISSFTPTSISAGTGSLLTINGSGFGSTPGSVRFINSNTGSAFSVDASDITSWADNQITVIVPSTTASGGCAGTGPITVVDASSNSTTSSSNLTVTFGYTNFLFSGSKVGAKLVNVNGLGGLTFTLSTTLCNSSQQDAVNAIGRALREWRCVSGVNWRFSTSTTSGNSESADGISIITYDVGTPLPGGVLGRATSYFNACSSGGGFHWRVSEIDINMRQSGVTWYFCDSPVVPGGQFDFQSVAFHEFGHGHQLQHIVDNTAVMHRSIGPGQARRVLNSNEEDGADYVLSLPANPCGPGPMTLLSHPACLSLTPPSACNAAGPCTAPLPVELLYFTAQTTDGGVRLRWETATERDNDLFTIERSTDAQTFQTLGRVRGAGNSNQRRKYEYFDAAPLPGINYYRLWQTDYDGATALLHLVSVFVGEQEDTERLRIFPNPVPADQVYLEVASDLVGSDAVLFLFDALGREMARQTIVAQAYMPVDLAAHRLSPGIYTLRLWLPEQREWLGPVRVWKP